MTVLFNGSPKATGGNSALVEKMLEPLLAGEVGRMDARRPAQETFRALCGADAVILVFPLYVDSLPSHLLRFLLELEEYARGQKPESPARFYAVAQCGFYEGKQNRYALEALEHFCARSGFRWCGGVGLGCGGALEGMMKKPLAPLEELLSQLAEAVREGRALPENRFASMGIPRWTYSTVGNIGWIVSARKNGLKRKDLYRRLPE